MVVDAVSLGIRLDCDFAPESLVQFQAESLREQAVHQLRVLEVAEVEVLSFVVVLLHEVLSFWALLGVEKLSEAPAEPEEQVVVLPMEEIQLIVFLIWVPIDLNFRHCPNDCDGRVGMNNPDLDTDFDRLSDNLSHNSNRNLSHEWIRIEGYTLMYS